MSQREILKNEESCEILKKHQTGLGKSDSCSNLLSFLFRRGTKSYK